ncbi:MAG: ABC transporter permease, partial [Pseudomonadota bacterium]
MMILVLYVAIFLVAFFAVRFVAARMAHAADFTSLKTVTFGDESAITPNRAASVISVLAIFLIWGAFTGSKLVPVHAPGPFVGDTGFTYTARGPDGATDDATVSIRVFNVGEEAEDPTIEPGDGFAKNDATTVGAWRSRLVRVDRNDELGRDEGVEVVAIDGEPIAPGETVSVADGAVTLSDKGTPNFKPHAGMQMEPIWLPSPEAVWTRLVNIAGEGYQNFTLL